MTATVTSTAPALDEPTTGDIADAAMAIGIVVEDMQDLGDSPAVLAATDRIDAYVTGLIRVAPEAATEAVTVLGRLIALEAETIRASSGSAAGRAAADQIDATVADLMRLAL